MSLYSTSKNQNQPSPISQEQEDYIRQLQAQKEYLKQQKTLKYKSILQKTYQMEETGTNTNINLKGQTQKLQNIHSITDETGKLIKKANQTSKQLSSFWYSLGKKIIKVFVKDTDTQSDNRSQKTKQNETYQTKSDDTCQKFAKCSQPNQIQNQSDQDNLDDHYLDELTNQVGKLKGMAKETNKQLTKQCDLINKIDKKTDFNSAKMEEANKRLKKNFF